MNSLRQLSAIPWVSFDRIDDAQADYALSEWGHFLGPCRRPFGQQSFGLRLGTEIVAVAVSASTVNSTCAGFARREVVELARLCAAPEFRSLTRVALRLWRTVAFEAWRYWPCVAAVAYANSTRHRGDIYRFDGWRKFGDVRGGTAGGNWTRGKRYDPKSVWVFPADAKPGYLSVAPAESGGE